VIVAGTVTVLAGAAAGCSETGAESGQAPTSGPVVTDPSSTTSATPDTAPSTSNPSVTLPVPDTTTTVPPTTVPPSPGWPTPPPSNETDVLAAGSEGPRTQQLQARLAELHFDPGPFDGVFGTKTTQAVWAFQHVHGLAADGQVTPEVWAAIETAADAAPARPDGGPDRVEIDIAKQVLTVYAGGAVQLVTHVSTGHGGSYCDNGTCGTAITPTGDFSVLRRISGWRTSALGQLYNPLYFTGGFAIHGSGSVPNQPASHGCVRVPMHIAEYLPDLVANGEPVYVIGA
jgi:peptidoglycan hydrolase-like protein with peptidoglycan-binding domain